MTDYRLYRLAFAPALLAVVTVMFSLEGPPPAIEPVVAPTTFEAGPASAMARRVAATAPEREPGGAGDEAAADLVAEAFGEIRSGTVSEIPVTAEVDGEEAELRNVALTLPGDPGRTLVVIAPRDSADGPGAASSAAATGVLVELADALTQRDHALTIVLVSASGIAAGSESVLELLEALPEAGAVEAVVVVSQPGAADPERPFVVASSSGTKSASAQLERTARRAVEEQVGADPEGESAFTQLARLAFPAGLGPQAPLIAAGTDAVAISAAGERPLPPAEDGPEDVSAQSLDAFGRAVQATVTALDTAPAAPEHGPGAYVEVADSLVPGWTLSLLALALIVPAAVAAVDAFARAARRSLAPARGLAWAASRSLPLVGALALLFALAAIGLVPREEFPFDPGLHPLGGRAALSLALLALAAAASAALLLQPGRGAAPPSALPAAGLLAAGAALVVWFANPYLGLLVAPLAHLWVVADRGGGRGRPLLVAALGALALLPALAALAALASALDLGADAPWTLTLMVADGQIGFATALAGCVLLVAPVLATVLASRTADASNER